MLLSTEYWIVEPRSACLLTPALCLLTPLWPFPLKKQTRINPCRSSILRHFYRNIYFFFPDPVIGMLNTLFRLRRSRCQVGKYPFCFGAQLASYPFAVCFIICDLSVPVNLLTSLRVPCGDCILVFAIIIFPNERPATNVQVIQYCAWNIQTSGDVIWPWFRQIRKDLTSIFI